MINITDVCVAAAKIIKENLIAFMKCLFSTNLGKYYLPHVAEKKDELRTAKQLA